jgi:hypothetical protein
LGTKTAWRSSGLAVRPPGFGVYADHEARVTQGVSDIISFLHTWLTNPE